MAYSIYEVDGYQDIAKPSDLLGENDQTQDVFTFNHPDSDHSVSLDNGDLYSYENSEFTNNYNPSNWDNQENYLTFRANSIIAKYRLEHDSVSLTFSPISKEGHTKVAISIADLMRATSRDSRQYAPDTSLTMVEHDKKKSSWMYHVIGFKEWSDRGGYQVMLELEKGENKPITQYDVKVSCSCPYWKYRGPDYNANRGDFLEGEPWSNLTFPTKTDPSRKNLICKHVYAVGLVIEKVVARYDLDNQKEVDAILEILKEMQSSLTPEITAKAFEEITKAMPITERKKIEKIIKKYKLQKNDKNRSLVFNDMLSEAKEQLEGQQKKLVVKILNELKNTLNISKRYIKDKLKKEELKEKKLKLKQDLDLKIKERNNTLLNSPGKLKKRLKKTFIERKPSVGSVIEMLKERMANGDL